MSWEGVSDTESGVTSVEACLGFQPHACDVTAYTAGNVTAQSAVLGVVPLQDGQSYYATVRVTNGAGATNTSVSSAFRVDGSPPLAGRVIDMSAQQYSELAAISDAALADLATAPTPASYTISTTCLFAYFDGFRDPHSSVQHYSYAWCDAGHSACPPADGAFVPVEGAAATTHVGVLSQCGLPLRTGSRYHVVVRASNEAGLTTDAVSPGVIVDNTPPAVPGHAWSALPSVQASWAPIVASWSGITDADSGVTEYLWSAGCSPQVADLVDWRSVGSATEASAAPAMAMGCNGDGSSGAVYIGVRAINNAGLETTTFSPPITVDTTPPVTGSITIVSTSDDAGLFQTQGEMLEVEWEGFYDDESQLAAHVVRVFAAGDSSSLVATAYLTEEEVEASQLTLTALQLQSGVSYAVALTVTNGAGVNATASTTVTIDVTPPTGGKVSDGPEAGVDIDWLDVDAQLYGLSATWDGWVDTESDIVLYEWLVTATRTTGPLEFRAVATSVFDWAPVGTNTSAALDGITLHPSLQYHVFVRATNAAGLSQGMVCVIVCCTVYTCSPQPSPQQQPQQLHTAMASRLMQVTPAWAACTLATPWAATMPTNAA